MSGLVYGCYNPAPESEELYFAELNMYRPSEGYIRGNGSRQNVFTIFSFLGVQTGMSISVRFVQLGTNVTGSYLLYVREANGTEKRIGFYIDPKDSSGNLYIDVLAQKFEMDRWVKFKVYYNLATLSNEAFQYLSTRTSQKNNDIRFSEPVKVFSNVTGGTGIFAAMNISTDSLSLNY